MRETEEAWVSRALFQSVEAGFAVRNPDGSYSITPKGRAHAEKLRKRLGDEDGLR